MYKRSSGIRAARGKYQLGQPMVPSTTCRLAVDSYKNAKAVDDLEAQFVVIWVYEPTPRNTLSVARATAVMHALMNHIDPHESRPCNN
jgi:hypothetical protein